MGLWVCSHAGETIRRINNLSMSKEITNLAAVGPSVLITCITVGIQREEEEEEEGEGEEKEEEGI